MKLLSSILFLLLATTAHADCDSGATCLAAGAEHERADPDLREAARLYQRACDRGELRGCEELARLYDWGWSRKGISRDVKRSLELYRKACDGGVARACDSLGLLLRSGQGVPHDLAEALRLEKKACDGGAPHGCTSLGFFYEQGIAVAADAARARALYLQACDGGDYQGCDNVGLLDEKRHESPLPMFERSCKLDSGYGCRRAAALYRTANQTKLAIDRYHRACLLHEREGCEAWCELVPGKGSCLERFH